MSFDPREMAQYVGGQSAETAFRPNEPGMPPGLLDRIIAEAAERIAQAQAERPSPFRLDTWEDIERFAEMAARSDMVPASYKNKPGNIIIAVLRGKELGIPPMAALDSIAVVNGRPALWGEMVPALCLRSGQVEDFTEELVGDGETLMARCTVKRRGLSVKVGEFSVADVRRAKLGNVHALYPRDMMMWRARHRAWHAAFPDVLKGLATAEVAEDDAARPEWKMPPPAQSWFVQRDQVDAGDGWTSAWIDDAAQKLRSETNAWTWLGLLEELLAQVPTLRDLTELDTLPVVVDAATKAPEQARQAIDTAFATAKQRLLGDKATPAPATGNAPPAASTQPQTQQPAQDDAAATAPPATRDGPAFDALLVDHNSDPISDDSYDDPVAWARAFADELARSINPMAMIEANADARADAAQNADAARIVDEAVAPVFAAATAPADDDLPVVAPASERGAKPAWGRYSKDVKDALVKLPPGRLMDFIASIREDVESAPPSTRQLIAASISGYCKGHQIDMPEAWLRSLVAKPAGAVPQSEAPAPATSAAAPPADETKPDPDIRMVENIGRDLETMKFPTQVGLFQNGEIVKRLRIRLEAEGKTDLVARLDALFSARLAAIKAANHQGEQTNG